MNRIAALLVLAFFLPLSARADDASHRAKAEELMTLLHTEKAVQAVSDNVMRQLSQVADKAAGATPSPESKAKIEDFKKQASQTVETQVSWSALKTSFVDIYVKSFTEEELDGMIAFYKSPTGVALLDKMPEVNSQVQQIGQSHLQTLLPELQKMIADLNKSLTPPTPAGPASGGPVSPSAAPASPAVHESTPATSPAAPPK